MITVFLKRLLLIFSLIIICGRSIAQPPGVPFQVVVRDLQGNLAKNSLVYVKGAILQGSMTGPVTYEETFQVTTNQDGIYTIIIGQGTVVPGGKSNSLSQIDWANGPYFFNLKMALAPSPVPSSWDPASHYQDYVTSQFWSAVYAFYAANASISNVNKSIQAGPPNTFLITDSSGHVNWLSPLAAQTNIAQVQNIQLSLSLSPGQVLTIPPNSTTLIKLTIVGAKVGDPVIVAPLGDYQVTVFSSWVSADNEVSVKFSNFQSVAAPVSGNLYKIIIIK